MVGLSPAPGHLSLDVSTETGMYVARRASA